MRNLLLLFILFLGLGANSFAQPTVYLDFPDIVFSEIPTRVDIRVEESDTIPPFFIQIRQESVDTLWVQKEKKGKK